MKCAASARACVSSSEDATSNDAACDGSFGALAWIAHSVRRRRASE